ncbi:hypothetical protein CYMTET_27384 [Cymbomonas tetramitiformis]|uniref:Uncharacterized protein n=1 Tax=Cymbomonas tetramitiformis TaxID=36881 RepID=A0AAE0FRH9_9CHLO|nr:hypothetical protein CYMTET_27384 [Cymbomonas tetramitiformis]
MQQMKDLNARVKVAEETAAKAASQGGGAIQSRDAELEALKRLPYVPHVAGNPFRPAYLETDMPPMYDPYNDKTYNALSQRMNSSMRYEQLVLAPVLSYMHDAIGASTESDATTHGGADALRAKLAFIEEKVYAGSDGLVTNSVLTKWLKEFDTTKAKAVMQTHAKANAKVSTFRDRQGGKGKGATGGGAGKGEGGRGSGKGGKDTERCLKTAPWVRARRRRHVSVVFLVRKPGTNKWCLVMDFCWLNAHCVKSRCKMESLKKLRRLAKPEDWIEALRAHELASRVLVRLGLGLNEKKGQWEPTQLVEHLGLEGSRSFSSSQRRSGQIQSASVKRGQALRPEELSQELALQNRMGMFLECVMPLYKCEVKKCEGQSGDDQEERIATREDALGIWDRLVLPARALEECNSQTVPMYRRAAVRDFFAVDTTGLEVVDGGMGGFFEEKGLEM